MGNSLATSACVLSASTSITGNSNENGFKYSHGTISSPWFNWDGKCEVKVEYGKKNIENFVYNYWSTNIISVDKKVKEVTFVDGEGNRLIKWIWINPHVPGFIEPYWLNSVR